MSRWPRSMPGASRKSCLIWSGCATKCGCRWFMSATTQPRSGALRIRWSGSTAARSPACAARNSSIPWAPSIPEAPMFPPQRIVCLTEETVETLYLLGEEARIVGVSGYAVRPPQVRREKPRVSAFISADIPKILALEPDLVLAFSDLQAGIVADLVRAGVAIHVFNQRDIAGILAMIRTLGAIVGAAERAEELARGFEARLADITAA